MNKTRWFLVIPTEGAARTVAHHTAASLQSIVGNERFKSFDTGTYQTAFTQLLKQPDPTMAVDLLNQSLIVSCLDFGATHCIVTALCPVTLFTLQLLQKQGIATVHWFYEDYKRATYWKSILQGYHHFCCIQHGDIEKACHDSNVQYHFLPTATGCGQFEYQQNDRPFDVVFIGIPSSYRISLLEYLASQNDIHLAIAGSGWQNCTSAILKPSIVTTDWMNDEAAFQLMVQAKIGINLSFDDPHDRDEVHISPRAFDLLAAGCHLVTEKTALLDESLPDATYHTFSSVEEAGTLITSLCKRYSETAEELKRNRDIVLSKHQYSNRIASLMEFLGDEEV
jgi:hypothetical protein